MSTKFSENVKSLHILIIGGGLAGLSPAHVLNKDNGPFMIVDRKTEPQGRNWGVPLSWGVRDGYKSLDEVLAEYDNDVIERGQEVAISKTQTTAFHNCENFVNSPVFNHLLTHNDGQARIEERSLGVEMRQMAIHPVPNGNKLSIDQIEAYLSSQSSQKSA
ncbi:putative FAD-binding domain-containing protein [Seiridium unicorne]|uniref:FAD-binding domain-containing protein n=1 Tax=Seiridium unicorne TaxID=138068 RepID=A0ABR2VFR7_9PEZI